MKKSHIKYENKEKAKKQTKLPKSRYSDHFHHFSSFLLDIKTIKYKSAKGLYGSMRFMH